jgi:hypothetical protein
MVGDTEDAGATISRMEAKPTAHRLCTEHGGESGEGEWWGKQCRVRLRRRPGVRLLGTR